MIDLKKKIKELPRFPGVYYFYDKFGRLLYIGKAAVLRTRVSSYFQKTTPNPSLLRMGNTPLTPRLIESRQNGIVGLAFGQALKRGNISKMDALVEKIADIKVKETDSVLEALILEAQEIKKYQPPYNRQAKDDKTFVYIVITDEEFPRALIARPTEKLDFFVKKTYGPYTSAKSAREVLKIFKKIFPYHSGKEHSEKKCLDFHIGLCSGPYAGAISKKDYAKNIRGIEAVLKGKKKGLLRKLEREMKILACENKFEKAAVIRNKIFALKHIRDTALLVNNEIVRAENFQPLQIVHRIEAYDISNISGKYAVGSMVVFKNGEMAKNEYRKFKIKTVNGVNDVAMMCEVLERRLKHTEWEYPDLILVDGGKGQVNAAKNILDLFGNKNFRRPIVVGAAKGQTRKNLDLYFADGVGNDGVGNADLRSLQRINKKLIAHIMSEAHRFAVSYHRVLRSKCYREQMSE